MDTLLALFLTFNSPKAVPAKALAEHVEKVSKNANIDPVLLAQIIIVESKGVPYAYNKRSKDHGIMQINNATARSMGLSRKCLYSWKCNVEAGALILSSLKRNGKLQACHYNTGPKGHIKKPTACKKYQSKLDYVGKQATKLNNKGVTNVSIRTNN